MTGRKEGQGGEGTRVVYDVGTHGDRVASEFWGTNRHTLSSTTEKQHASPIVTIPRDTFKFAPVLSHNAASMWWVWLTAVV